LAEERVGQVRGRRELHEGEATRAAQFADARTEPGGLVFRVEVDAADGVSSPC
jgi:hypothetical protein